jgi:hypothetical protein
MIHSRPGFAPRNSEETVARLNDDMVPAIHRGKKKEETTPLQKTLQTRADEAFERLRRQQVAAAQAEAMAIAAKVGPDLLVNPTPSAAPLVLEPGK